MCLTLFEANDCTVFIVLNYLSLFRAIVLFCIDGNIKLMNIFANYVELEQYV